MGNRQKNEDILAGDTVTAARRQLRNLTLQRRDAMAPAVLIEKSRAITASLAGLDAFIQARTICVFIHFRSEPRTDELINLALAAGKGVAVPKTLPDEKRLTFHLITSLTADLQPGFCSIPEPDPLKTRSVTLEAIDLVVIPGSVFDAAGNRLGYGGGYYDRFLALEAPAALRIAIGFECQFVTAIPALPHDIPVDILVTESKVRFFVHRYTPQHISQGEPS